MKTVVIISDTHGLLRPQVEYYLRGADAILHAGDINTQAILDRLEAFAPVYVVRGNNDKDWAQGLSHHLSFSIDGVRFYMVHNKRDVPSDLANTDVVVYGHSHKYAQSTADGVLWLNPGSCGRRRFDQDITLALMQIENGSYQVEKILIPQG